MSNLLFDERPLVLQPRLAFLLGGSDEAIILQQVHYWTQKNMNIRDDYSWVYNSMKEWHKQFYWISESSVKRIFTKLEKKGVLITGNYNKAKFDKTKWYRIDYGALDEMEQRLGQIDLTSGSKRPNGAGQVDPTNTIDYTETTTEMIDREIDTREKLRPVFDFYERNKGYMADVYQQKFVYEYQEWKSKKVEHDEIINIFKLAIEIVLGKDDVSSTAPYAITILKNWFNNNLLSLNAIEGDRKRRKECNQRKQQRQNGYKPRQERDLSNKHYGTDEELEAEFFGEG